MIKLSPFDEYIEAYERWFDEHPVLFESEIAAIREQFKRLPENIRGIQVGIGTGIYATELGLKEGVEPSEDMRKIAISKGLDVLDGKAEFLPYRDYQFDFVLFVTICHFKDIDKALREAFRVLKPDGSLIIGFIEKNRLIGQQYEAKRSTSRFYKQARFYSVEEVIMLLQKNRFKNLSFVQTLSKGLDTDEVEYPIDGFDKGSFIVVKASKA